MAGWPNLSDLIVRAGEEAPVGLLGVPLAVGSVTPGGCDRAPTVLRETLRRIGRYDVETGRELYVDPETVRERYRQKFAAHAEALRTTCHRLGVDLYDLPTSQPLEHALFDLLNSRMRRGRQVSRRVAVR